VDDEIHFGEVEQAAPQRALRPDENRHYAVAAYGEPAEADLPVFVDLDVLADMEEHAQSDTSVELGGVLLGGHYEDEQGRPFVVVTDGLRAQHYESTKGSFKFTHDTWSAITREREQFPDELQMVGWYHTHPSWGVFLSGMDMFICDNFFNKKLDVAYVIDPCRGERGMFQWTDNPGQRVRRTGGFFVTASRFRAAELENYVTELSGAMPATSMRSTTGASSAPVVHLHQPQHAEPPWQAPAILGVLVIQFLLVALIGWRVLVPAAGARSPQEEKIAAALTKLDSTIGSVEARRQADLARERTRAQAELLDQVVRELKGTDAGFVTSLQDRYDQSQKLTEDVAARDARIRELAAQGEEHRSRLQALEARSKADEERLRTQLASVTIKNDRLLEDLEKSKAELRSMRAKLEPESADDKAAAGSGRWYSLRWWAIGALAAVAVVAGVWWIGGSRGAKPDALTEPSNANQ
jgi:proteasome lid subunit RPN8/RPN11